MSEAPAPIPPADARVFQTCCKYCIVGCGYRVYKWPEGRDGGVLPEQNAFGADLRRGDPRYWISPTQHGSVRDRDGTRSHVAIVPDDACVVNGGLSSIRGGTLGMTLFRESTPEAPSPTADRLRVPLVGSGAARRPASWEDAVGLVAGVAQALLERDGPDAIGVKFSDHGGQGGGFEFTWATGKFFYESVRTTMATAHNRPTVFGEPAASRDMGIPELNIAYEDARLADTIVIFGANPYADQTNYYYNHMVPNLTGATVAEKRAAFPDRPARAGRMIVIDPRETITVASARAAAGAANVLHLQVASGTDVTLLQAIARVVVERGWQDHAFIRERVEADSYAPYLDALALARPLEDVLAEAARVTGVPAARLIDAAEWIAKPVDGRAPATLFHYEKGAIWSVKNYDVVAAYAGLAVLTGNLGKPGTGCARLGGHQEGYVRPDYPGKRPGVNVERLLANGTGPKLWWTIGCNPVQTAPDATSVERFMDERGAPVAAALANGGTLAERVRNVVAAVDAGGLFVVASDIYPTETTSRAHVVFPAATQFELDMTSINGERRLRLYQKFVDPPGEAKPDWEIVALVARALHRNFLAAGDDAMAARFAGYDWQTDADVFREASDRRTLARGGGADGALPRDSTPTFDPQDIAFVDHATLLSYGNDGIQTPIDVIGGERRGTIRLFADGRFARPSGRARFVVPRVPELPPEIAAQKAKYRYLVNNGRFNAMWQTGYETWRVAALAGRFGSEPTSFLELHPLDAVDLQVANGDTVAIRNDYGRIETVVYLSEGVRPKQPFLLFAQGRGRAAGALVTPHVDPETNVPSYKLTYADIERVARRPPALAGVSFKDPEVPERAQAARRKRSPLGPRHG